MLSKCQESGAVQMLKDRSSHAYDPSRHHFMNLFICVFICIAYKETGERKVLPSSEPLQLIIETEEVA
jgi:hypothetical protein